MLGCSTRKIIITNTFLIVDNSEGIKNFKVIQISPKDNLVPPTRYVESAEFRFISVSDKKFKWGDKLFFNKNQAGIRWEILPLNDSIWVPPTYNECTMDTIGKLKSNCWYLFKGLHNFGYKYFVYFDNSGEAKVYEVNKSNY